MRAIVTGGAGFVGSHVAEALVARGDQVHVVDSLATGRRENVPEGAELHERDIREPLADLFDDVRPQACFHLAAQADVGTSVERPDYDADVNVVGTVRVLEAARRHGTQLVFSSTGGALYGECERPASEDDPRRPLSPYGTSKLAGEEYLATWNRLHRTRHVTTRLGNVFGPRQLPTLEGGVVSIFMDRLASGQGVTIFGDGEQTRDFVYVGDVVGAMLAAVGHPGGLFNVGTGIQTSVNDLFEACRRVSGVDGRAEHGPPRLGELRHSVLDPGRAERELGWRRSWHLDRGLRATWDWVTAS